MYRVVAGGPELWEWYDNIGNIPGDSHGDLSVKPLSNRHHHYRQIVGMLPLGALPAHAPNHEIGGSDPIKLDDLNPPDDNTDLNASVATHGLCPKLSGNFEESLRGDGSWAVDCPILKSLVATGLAEGDIHLSDAVYWNISKALIKEIIVVTNSIDWSLYILQNDNGHAANDARIKERQLVSHRNGNIDLMLSDLYYEDEDGSGEIHLYYVDHSGANTMDITILGVQAR